MSIATAISTINVPFHGADLFVVNHNGEPYTPMKPIVEGMGMDWMGQYKKLKQRYSKGIEEISIPTAGGMQKMICLALRKLSAWLNTISPNKVRPEIRDRVIQYQEECDDVLYDYWTKGQAINPRRPVGRPRKDRNGLVTIEQQQAIKELVMSRGKTLPKDQQAKAMITMWSSLKAHFGCGYKEIPEGKFSEALSLAARVPLDGEFIPAPKATPQLANFPMGRPFRYLTEVAADGTVNSMTILRSDEFVATAERHTDMLNHLGLVVTTWQELSKSTSEQITRLWMDAKERQSKNALF